MGVWDDFWGKGHVPAEPRNPRPKGAQKGVTRRGKSRGPRLVVVPVKKKAGK